jgi:hypothetical protein
MPRFQLNDEFYNIPDDISTQFLQDNPDAIEITSTELGKIDPPKENNQGAPAGEIAAPEIQPTVTELPSEDISLDLAGVAKTGTVEDTTIKEDTEKTEKEARKGLLDATINIKKEDVLDNFKTKYFGKEVFEPSIDYEERLGPMGYQSFPTSREKTDSEIREILGDEKYNQFVYFQENNDLNPDLFKNEYEYIQALSMFEKSEAEEKKSSAERYLRNTPETVAKAINIYKDYEYESSEDLNNRIGSLNIQQETVLDAVNEFNQKNPSIEQDIKEINTQLGSLKLKINLAENDTEYNALVTEYNNILKSKDYKKTSEAASYYDSLVKESKEVSSKLKPLIEDAIDINVIEKALQKDYSKTYALGSYLEQFWGSSIASFGAQVFESLAKGSEYSFMTQGMSTEQKKDFENSIVKASESLTGHATDYASSIAKRFDEKIPKPLELDDIGKNNITFTDYVASVAIQNSGSISAIAIPGGGAKLASGALGQAAARSLAKKVVGSVFVASETGSQRSQLEIEQANAKKNLSLLNEQYKNATSPSQKSYLFDQIELAKSATALNYTKSQKALNSYIHGGVAGVAERLGSLRIFNGFNNIAKGTATGLLNKSFEKVLRPLLKAPIIESVEEGVTSITQKGLGNVILDKNENIFEDLTADFFANTGITSLIIAGPSTMSNVQALVSDELRTAENKRNQNRLNQRLTEQVVSLEKLDGRTKQARKLKKEIQNTVDEMGMNELLAGTQALTLEQIKEVGNLNVQLRSLQQEAANLGSSGEFNTTQVKEANNRIQAKAQKIIAARESILNKPVNDKVLNIKNSIEQDEELTQEQKDLLLSPERTVQRERFSALHLTSIEVAKASGRKVTKLDGDDFELNKDGYFILKDNGPVLSEKGRQKLKDAGYSDEFIKKSEEVGFNYFYGRFEGTDNILLNEYNINKALAFADLEEMRIAATSPVHELSHINNIMRGVVDEKGNIIAPLENAFSDLENELESKYKSGLIDEKTYNNSKERIKLYTEEGKLDLEELGQLFLDLKTSGALSKEDTSIETSFKIFANDVMFSLLGPNVAPYFKLKNGKEVLAYIDSFVSKIESKGRIQIAPPEEIEREVQKFSRSQKASDEVQRIYEEQGVAGAMDIIEQFKPITNKLVNKYRNVPGFEFELLKDEIETGKRGILDMIMEYTPEKAKGAPLAAYINTFLSRRAIEASNRILKTDFELDVTEAKAVTDTTTTEEIVEEKEVAVADEIKSLRKEIGLPENLVTTVKDAVIKTFGTKLPNPQDPKFRFELQKRFRTELKKPLSKFVGTRANYENFLRDNFESIYNKLPLRVINKRFLEFSERVLDENGNQIREKTRQGNPVFTKKKIAKAEWLKYFLGPGLKDSSKSTRKTNILESIAEEIAFDATMEVLNDPDIIQKYQDIAEITGEVLPENFKSLIAKQIDRNENFKFSKSLPNTAKTEYGLGQQELARILDETSLDKLSNKYPLISDAIIYEAEPTNSKFSLATKADGKWEQDPLNPLADYAKKYDFKVGSVNYQTSVVKSNNADIDYNEFENDLGLDADVVIEDPKSIAVAFTDEKGEAGITKFAEKGLTNQFKVFGTVANSVIDLIKEDDLNSVTFTAKEKSRKRLYQSLVNRFSEELGWDTYNFEDESGTIFIAYNPKAFNIEQQTIEQKETIESEILRQNSNLKFSKTIQNINTKEKVKVKDILGKSFKDYDPAPDVIGTFEVFWKNVKQGISKNYKTIDGIIKPYDARFYKSIAYEYWTAKKWLITHPQLELISNDFKGFDPTGSGDLTFRDKNNNRTFSVEVKMTEAAIMSTGSLRFENGEIIPSKNPIEIFQYIKNLLIANNFIDGLSDVLKATKRKSIPLYNITDAEKQIIDPIKKNKLNKTIVLDDTSNINNVYSKKGVDYFDIGGYIYTVSADPMGFEAPKLNGEALVTARLKYTGKNEKGLRSAFVAVENKLANKGKDLKKATKVNDLKFSKSLNKEFNEILAESTGVKWTERFSPAKAAVMAKGKGRGAIFVPYSADDFVGLLYTTLSGGPKGDRQMEWYRENLLRPFSRGIQAYEAEKQRAMREWSVLKQRAKKDVPGGLRKQNESGFTNEQSLRMYIWASQGLDVPNIKKGEVSEAVRIVKNNEKFKNFADTLMGLNPEGYPEPSNNWIEGDITTDLIGYVNESKRAEYLTEWKNNVDIIFSEKNMTKLRALYGDRYVEALNHILKTMETGVNRKVGQNKQTRLWMDWVNNSVGSIMFFNARSAVLQTLSAVNFINFSDNNPINAALALANFGQYRKDFVKLFNSDFLKQRRSGLQVDVSADEIARATKGSERSPRALFNALLKFGFTPTQMADSFAIASGGATFYRNRIKKYTKEGLSAKEAEERAFTDFQEISEETQQSSRPDRVSMEQAGGLGRVILAFANTPMQYARLQKKAALDLYNKRGDWKTNISKIVYYGVIQNIIFTALQQALFALLFDDEEEPEEKERYYRIANSASDNLLRGIGVYGAAASTVKNVILEIIDQEKSGRRNYTDAVIAATSISPPINSKLRKLESAGKTFKYKQSREKIFTEGLSLENPALLATGKIISAGTNIPADRVVTKLDHIKTAMEPETELWQSIALSLGWGEWELGMIDRQTKKSKTPLRKNKKTAGRRTSKRRTSKRRTN